MNVVVTCEYRFFKTTDGRIWTANAFDSAFWQRYLSVFDKVIIVARAQEVDEPDSNWKRVDSARISLVALPHYVGLAGLIKHVPRIITLLRSVLGDADAIIFRVPSQTAMLASLLIKPTTPYALEVVGDPEDVFAAGITSRWLDKILGTLSARSLRKMASGAVAVSYVTERYLQNKYPASTSAFSIACSSIELKEEWFATAPRVFNSPARNLLFIGSLEQLYKGPDVLLKALEDLNRSGGDYSLSLLGKGVYQPDLEKMAADLNIADKVKFVGEVNKDEVKRHLQNADVLIMPSRTEGLPRALIEAMALGLPAIGSDAGGIPELLDESCLFPSEDADALRDRIRWLCQSPENLNHQAQRNLLRAKDFTSLDLNQRRQAFYQYISKIRDKNENVTFA